MARWWHGRRGGPVATASAVSRPVMTNQTVLGRRGPDRVCGHVCPECDTAIDEAGAIGQTAIRWAVITHVGRTSQTRAKRLRALLDEDFRPVLPAEPRAVGPPREGDRQPLSSARGRGGFARWPCGHPAQRVTNSCHARPRPARR
jgi:hypothetical protein